MCKDEKSCTDVTHPSSTDLDPTQIPWGARLLTRNGTQHGLSGQNWMTTFSSGPCRNRARLNTWYRVSPNKDPKVRERQIKRPRTLRVTPLYYVHEKREKRSIVQQLLGILVLSVRRRQRLWYILKYFCVPVAVLERQNIWPGYSH